mmetsp:Transcript_7254/g.21413  ORF Transcript_7254/g.21413 Transcript_7254/m.21413 type:complete len:217 (+) Transcript_7254:1954-2604(+)
MGANSVSAGCSACTATRGCAGLPGTPFAPALCSEIRLSPAPSGVNSSTAGNCAYLAAPLRFREGSVSCSTVRLMMLAKMEMSPTAAQGSRKGRSASSCPSPHSRTRPAPSCLQGSASAPPSTDPTTVPTPQAQLRAESPRACPSGLPANSSPKMVFRAPVMPLKNPPMKRAATASPKLPAAPKATMLTEQTMLPITTTGRRPRWSDKYPHPRAVKT